MGEQLNDIELQNLIQLTSNIRDKYKEVEGSSSSEEEKFSRFKESLESDNSFLIENCELLQSQTSSKTILFKKFVLSDNGERTFNTTTDTGTSATIYFNNSYAYKYLLNACECVKLNVYGFNFTCDKKEELSKKFKKLSILCAYFFNVVYTTKLSNVYLEKVKSDLKEPIPISGSETLYDLVTKILNSANPTSSSTVEGNVSYVEQPKQDANNKFQTFKNNVFAKSSDFLNNIKKNANPNPNPCPCPCPSPNPNPSPSINQETVQGDVSYVEQPYVEQPKQDANNNFQTFKNDVFAKTSDFFNNLTKNNNPKPSPNPNPSPSPNPNQETVQGNVSYDEQPSENTQPDENNEAKKDFFSWWKGGRKSKTRKSKTRKYRKSKTRKYRKSKTRKSRKSKTRKSRKSKTRKYRK